MVNGLPGSSSFETAGNQVFKKFGVKAGIQTEAPHSPEDIPSGSGKTEIKCVSDDLISLAYQAAEDGVEFMFVEEVTSTNCSYEQDIEVSTLEADNNATYIGSPEPMEVKI